MVKLRKRADDTPRIFEATFEQASIGMCHVALHGTLLRVNPRFGQICGQSAEELVGRSIDTLVHTDDRAAFLAQVRSLAAGEIPQLTIETRASTTAGDTAWFRLRLSVLSGGDEAGTDECLFGIAEDITEGKQLAMRDAIRLRQLKHLSELGLMLAGDPTVVFERVVGMLADLFNVRVVCLSEIVDRELWFRAVCVDGHVLRDAGHCPLSVTPCATVEATKDLRVYDCVMERFPEASFLRDYNAHAYCGFPAVANDGRVVAITCLLDDKSRTFTDEEQHILRVVGQRLAVEIERARISADRKRVEDDLRESEERLRLVISGTNDGIWDWNVRTGEDYLSPRWKELLGYRDEELPNVESSFFSRLHPDDKPAVDEAVDRNFELGEPYNMEARLRHKDGSYRWMLTRGNSVRDGAGRPIRMLGSITDITGRKLAEDALKAGQKQLASLIATARDAIVAADESQTVVVFNQAAERMFGYKASEMIGMPLRRLIPERFRDAHAKHVDAFGRSSDNARDMEGGRTVSGLRANGEEFPIDASISQATISGKKFFTKILRDITVHKRTEEALRESEEQFSKAFYGNPTGMAIRCVSDDLFTDVNRSFERLVGYSRNELLGKRVGDFDFYLQPELRENVLSRVALARQEPVRDLELSLRVKDGQVRHVLMSLDLITLKNRSHVLASFVDITERKLAERQVADSLRQKETLLREMHHRVKNNLQIISSLLHFQRKKVQDADAQAVLDEGRDRLRSMILIHEILCRSGNLVTVEFSDYARALVNQLCESYAASRASKIQVDINTGSVFLPVETALPCGMILSELTSNSFKHAFAGRPAGRLRIDVTRAGDSLSLVVEDDGVGIPEAARVESPASFGLQLVRNLANQLDATIEIGGSPGALVRVTVPLHTSPQSVA